METNEILDTSVAIGKNEGIVTIFTVIEHPPCSRKNFDILFPDMQDYLTSVEIATKLREKGTPVGAIDILIAAMGLNRSATIVAKDTDFSMIRLVVPLKIRIV